MSEDTTIHSPEPPEPEPESDEMLAEYDFSKAKPGRHRGTFQGRYIRVLEDGTEEAIEPKDRNPTAD
jgi:hypothetical protein